MMSYTERFKISLAYWRARIKPTCLMAGLLAAVAVANFAAPQLVVAQLLTVAEDDFENLHATMSPFTLPANVFADGTDFTKQIRVGSPREWFIDNSQMGNPPGSAAGGVCLEPGYNGWSAMDVASWTAEQGVQIGRTSLGLSERNTALIADPDAYYDFLSSPQPGPAYNSYIWRNYNLTGHNVNTLKITFDYEFAFENDQTGTVQVSFDGGATWQMLLELKRVGGVPSNNTIFRGPVTFEAGVHFNPTSNQMRLRFGCITANNNWWFAVDNVKVETVEANPFVDLEDFEGLTMGPFTVATPPTQSRFDGTDWTNQIPNWTIDNSQMLGFCREPAFDGWTALDIKCWVNEQGGQGRSIFDYGGFNANAALVADGDAFYDYDSNFKQTGRAPANAVNSYIQRSYDMNLFDNCNAKISLEFEFRIENQQRGTIEVSFNGGQTWQLLRELKRDPKNGLNNGAFIVEFVEFEAGVDFAPLQSNKMILRLGYLEADNNWWFAVDNVKVEATLIDYVKGDANGDDVLNFDDISAFLLALTNPAQYAKQYPTVNPNVVLDFDCNGQLDFDDISGFLNILIGN
jgi:hypothetical protein